MSGVVRQCKVDNPPEEVIDWQLHHNVLNEVASKYHHHPCHATAVLSSTVNKQITMSGVVRHSEVDNPLEEVIDWQLHHHAVLTRVASLSPLPCSSGLQQHQHELHDDPTCGM